VWSLDLSNWLGRFEADKLLGYMNQFECSKSNELANKSRNGSLSECEAQNIIFVQFVEKDCLIETTEKLLECICVLLLAIDSFSFFFSSQPIEIKATIQKKQSCMVKGSKLLMIDK